MFDKKLIKNMFELIKITIRFIIYYTAYDCYYVKHALISVHEGKTLNYFFKKGQIQGWII